jgi:NAD(P)-dependent dehydrogenase (short-subunit alcohol dehydrogenase family)
VDIRLDGRAAIVTGGSKGIGYAIATRFAQSGADVAVVARGREALDEAVKEIQKAAKARIVGLQGDVAVAADVKRIYDEAVKAFGKIDILVNNAGTSRNGKFEEITDEVWQDDFDLKVFAAIRFARLAWPDMKARRWGRIINVLNIGAKAPRAGSAPTTISRAAGMALTKVLSQEGAPHNILVNCMHVGFIEADQHVQRAKKMGMDLKDYYRQREKTIPLGRVGKADEFANLACFLASDAASYVTGTAINVDGGASPVV